MSEKPKEGLDRRGFMAASIATVGASAVLPPNTGPADAQDTATSPGATASGATVGTLYTGDVIDGKKVVNALDINDLEPGKKHFLYFQGVQTPTGQHWYVSVTVAKGAKPGKRGVLTSGVRDEFYPHSPDCHEPARAGADVGHGDGRHGRVPPGPGKHAAQMAQPGQRHRSDRSE